jgi:glycosyltransferase involved in cell wall biosynthesis
MDRPRIALFTPVYPPMKGGSATYFSTLSKMLSEKADITVICLQGEGPDDEDGVRIERVLPDRRAGHFIGRLLTVPPSAFAALWKMRRGGPFIIHAHSNGLYGLSASFFSTLFRVPMIKEVQDTSDRPFVLRSGKVDKWIAAGAFVKDRLLSAGIPEDRIMVLPSVNPPETSEIAKRLPPHERSEGVRLVFVGWLMNRVKGVDRLIWAFSEALKERDGMSLRIVGNGPDLGSLREMAKDLPVEFLGELPYERTLEEVRQSDILVLPSHEEANPRVVIEAFAVGTPVIATDVGGVKEQVKDGESGVLVPDGDGPAMVRSILRLASDEGLREHLAEGGRRYLVSLPSWEAISERIVQEYRRIWTRAGD